MSLFRQLLIANSRKKKRPYYCELEYLESTGTQYIDSVIAPSSITPIAKMKFIPTKQSDASGIFGCYGANNTRFQIYFNSIGIGTYVSKSWQPNTTYEVELNGKVPSATINGNVETSGYSKANGFSSDNMYLFTRNNGNVADKGVPLKLYYCKIYDNDTLVRDFIPVLDWDMKPCMYDKVSGELFYNKATSGDDFVAGRQIHPVEYLESSGTQYIDTGIIGTNENIGIDVTWAFSNNNANMCIFSSRSAQISNTLTLFWLKTTSNRMRFDGVGQRYFTDSVNASVSDDIFNFNYKSTTGAVATLTNKTTEHIQTLNIGKLETFSMNPLYLFCSRNNAYVYSWIKMYGCKIYDGDALVRDFIPMVDENGVGAMFERVSHTIYDNAGNGAFSYPPVELEYLESTGTQYIDTGIKPTDDYGYKIRNTYTRRGGEQCAIGCMNSGNRFVGVYTSGSANQLSGAWGSFVNFFPTYPWDTGDILDVQVNYKNSRKMIVNGTELKDISDIHISGTISNTLYLFARHYDNNITKMKGKVYGVEITNGQDVIHKYTPIIRDGVAGMLDTITGDFLTNAGTGNFKMKIKEEK